MTFRWILLVLLFQCSSNAFSAGKLEAGKKKSAECLACHGENGISNNDQWPSLAGQKRGYFIKSLQAYRAGQRVDVMMTPVAGKLTDQEMEDLAVYFSSLGK